MVYLIILFIILFFIYKFEISKQIKGKSTSIYIISFLLIMVSALRYRIGLDTMRYMEFYDNIPTIKDLSMEYYLISGHEPLYFLVEVFAKTISPDFFILQIFVSVFVNLVVINFLKKNTKYVFTAILLYYLVLYVGYNFEAMRQSTAVAIFLLSYKYLKEKNWIKYYLFCFIALMLHTSGLVMFFVPVFIKVKIDRYFILYLIIVIALFILVRDNMGTIFDKISITDRLSQKAEMYRYSEYSKNVLNVKGILTMVTIYMIIPYIALRNFVRLNSTRLDYEYLIILNMVIALLSFEAQIFSRYLDYFTPFLLLALVEYIGKNLYLPTTNNNLVPKLITSIYVFTFILIKINGQYFAYTNGVEDYYRYIPYYSVITEEKSPEREKLFRFSY